eukprot:2357064-Alexandrium_andersonii.AAC.1
MQSATIRNPCAIRNPRRALEGRRQPQQFHPPRPRPGDSAPFCAMNPMVTTKQAGGRAGGAFRGW